MNKTLIFLVALILVLGMTVSSYATLIDRGNGLIYDTDLNITWLANTNLAALKTFGVAGINADGTMTWTTAQSWIAAMDTNNYLGYSDWRQPSAFNQDGSAPCYGIDCTQSEFGHLYFLELGNTAGYSSTFNTGPFIDLQRHDYWTSTQYSPGNIFVYDFCFHVGFQDIDISTNNYYSWPVRNGDTLPVMEPGTLSILGLGLTGFALWGKRHVRRQR